MFIITYNNLSQYVNFPSEPSGGYTDNLQAYWSISSFLIVTKIYLHGENTVRFNIFHLLLLSNHLNSYESDFEFFYRKTQAVPLA